MAVDPNKPSPIDELMKQMSGVAGFNEGVQHLRDSRPAPAAPLPPSTTADPFSVDKIMKDGTPQERQQIVDSQPKTTVSSGGTSAKDDDQIAQEYGTLDLPGWDKRLEELGKEVKPAKTAGGFLGKLEQVKDIAGQPLGAALKALDAPAEGVERLIGMAYWNEVPLSDRWEMSRWTYDSIWSDMFNGGSGGKTEAVRDYQMGLSWDEIDKKYDDSLGNTIGHFMLDPMWLVGGIPLVDKLPVPGAKAIGAGLNFSKIPGLKEIPLVRNIGRPVLEEKLADTLDILHDAGNASENFNVGRKTGFVRQLFSKTADAHVDDAYSHITNVTSSLTDGRLWDGGAVRTMFQDLGSGQLTRQNMFGLEGTTPVKSMRRLFEANPKLGKTVDSFESLQPMSLNAFWDDAKHVLKVTHNGVETTIPELIKQGRELTPEMFSRYGSYRAIKFMDEFSQKGIPALHDVYGGSKSLLLAKADALSGAMKTALSMFTINTPSFVVMNWANNASTLITKMDDPAGLANFMSHGLTSRRTAALMELGFSQDLVHSIADDSSFFKEVAGGAANDLYKTRSKARRFIDKALPFVKLASKTDDGARITALEKGMLDASAAVWHSGDGGVLPVLTDLQKSVPELADHVDGLKFKSLGDLAQLQKMYESKYSDELINANGMLSAWAKSMAPQRFPGSMADMPELARWMETTFPDHSLNQIDDLIDHARELRRNGEADYLHGLEDQIDDWHDNVSLAVHDQKLASNLPPDPLPYNTVRVHNVPWVDTAEFNRQQNIRQELYTRIVAADHQAFGGLPQARQVQDGIREAMQNYSKSVREAMQATPKELSARVHTQLYADMGKALEERNRAISKLLADTPSARKTFQNATRVEREYFNAGRDIRVDAIGQMAGLGEQEQRTLWGQTLERAHKADADSLERTWSRVGIEYAPSFTANPEMPVSAQGFESMAGDVHDFLEFVKTDLPQRFRNASTLSDEQLTAARELLGNTGAASTARSVFDAPIPRSALNEAMRGMADAGVLGKDGVTEGEVEEFMRLSRNVALREKTSDPATWTEAQKALYDAGDWKGFSRSRGYSEAEISEFQQRLDMFNHLKGLGVSSDDLQSLEHFVVGPLVEAAKKTMPAAAGEPARTLADAMRQRNLVAAHHGRALRDWAMLNYSQKRGFDSILSLAFPYHFWIGRTAKDWMRLTQARPGQTAAMAQLFKGIQNINEDAGIPDRLKRNIRIPIPFFENAAVGPASLYVDPLRIIYPLSGFQALATDGGPNQDGTTKGGQMFDFMSNLGVGINPFMTLGLGATGALGDRTAYLRRGLASASSMPFGAPGPRVIRSAADWLAGISEDPDPEYLTPEIKERLANGEPLPENTLREALQGIADVASTDGFDGYRADRMVANLVGSDPERWSARDGLEALRYHSGPLWAEATKLSKGEKGLRVLTGWAFMPMQVYPEGEKVQRGLDAIFREVAARDDPKQMDDFFQQHPEYKVRKISQLDRDDPAGQLGELDTSLFYLDLDKVEQKFGQPIDLIRNNIRRMEDAGYLETKEGRRMRDVARNDVSQLTDLRQAELDQLDALYPHRSKDLSLRAAPHERALYQLREQYYAIRRDDFKSDEEFYAARDAFVQRIPVDGADAGEWMQAAVRSAAAWNQASEDAGARPALAHDIISQRDDNLRKLTDDNVGRVSREDFQRYMAQNGQPPSPNLIEYQKASQQISQYFAIAQAPGLSATTVKAYQKQFWQDNPLLQKYYGQDEPKAWNAESAYTYGRMDEIWKNYKAVENDPRAARDQLATALPELNDLRRQVGLYPLRLQDFQALAQGVFSRTPPMSEVLK